MIPEIDVLISLLKLIDNNEHIKVNDTGVFTEHQFINAAKCLVDEYLVDKDGRPNNDNMNLIIEAGIRIFPGETDRFGWLTGCIELSRGTILFG